jgi:hypothetical protein
MRTWRPKCSLLTNSPRAMRLGEAGRQLVKRSFPRE